VLLQKLTLNIMQLLENNQNSISNLIYPGFVIKWIDVVSLVRYVHSFYDDYLLFNASNELTKKSSTCLLSSMRDKL
jgi:hypothetical protein